MKISHNVQRCTEKFGETVQIKKEWLQGQKGGKGRDFPGNKGSVGNPEKGLQLGGGKGKKKEKRGGRISVR